MQTDQSTDSATVTTRREFLTRATVGGAMVTAAAIALPSLGLGSSAGAQDESEFGSLRDAAFGAFAAPLELAAVGAYNRAIAADLLDVEWRPLALRFQNNHQAVADTLITLLPDGTDAPLADAATAEKWNAEVTAATSQNALLLALADIEETLAATHLSAIGIMIEKSTAKTVTQVLTVEGQQAALLAVGGGTPVEEVTPATNSGDAAVPIVETTTTTTPAGSTDATTSSTSPSTATPTTTAAN